MLCFQNTLKNIDLDVVKHIKFCLKYQHRRYILKT